MPHKEHTGQLGGGMELIPRRGADLLIEQAVAAGVSATEVREALSHCPQCGSGRWKEYRANLA